LKTSEEKRAYGRAYWKNLTPDERAHKTAVRHAYFANMTPERRARHRAYQLRYLKTRPPEKIEDRKAYQRQAMNRRRQDPVYMAGFKAYYKEWMTSAKEHCINMYSNGEACCAWCPQSDIDVLCLDHIDEGQTKAFTEKYGHRGGKFLFAKLRQMDYPPGFQVLCSNCNLKKEILRRRTALVKTC